MEQINNTYIKIELSKIAETFIFNSSLNIETKNRLLLHYICIVHIFGKQITYITCL